MDVRDMKQYCKPFTLSFLCFVTLFISTESFANYYLGASLGVAADNVKYQTRNPTLSTTATRTYGLKGFREGVMFDTSKVFHNNVYLGFQSYALINQVKTTEHTSGAASTQSLTLDQQFETSHSLLLGYAIKKIIIPYIALGYSWSRWSADVSNNTGKLASKTNTLHGFRFGLGTAIMLNKKIRLDLGAYYVDYNHFGQSVNFGGGSGTQYDSYKPNTLSTMITISYLI